MPSNVAVVLAAVGLAACSSSPASPASPPSPASSAEPVPVEIGVVRSAQQRHMSPELSETERATFERSQADFAVDVYHAVRKEPGRADEDIFLSPHSISTALAMTYAGARGETAAEMKKALHFALPDDRLHTAFNYLDLALASRGKNAEGKDGKPFRLVVTNSIWGQRGTRFEAPFLDTLAINYGAGLNIVDFIAETERSRITINGWVEEKTERRIRDILPEGVVDTDTRLVLVNAVYFNAAWASKFEPSATAPGPFTKADGTVVQVPMMNRQTSRRYARGVGYEAVEMPYDNGKRPPPVKVSPYESVSRFPTGGRENDGAQADDDTELAMVVVLPAAGAFASFEASLTGGKMLEILASLEKKLVDLSFPKLKLDVAVGLKAPLATLGMNQAFTPAADFSGMSTTERLSVSNVLHKTFLEVDESGTEAAAATAVIVRNTSAPVAIEMKVDRPFIAAIVDRRTKTLLFLGRILEPKR
ncbi:MAG: serpin family protein [Labilithrix sp.]|nr:serpin family protein [Labilithrix sp.]